MVNSKRMWGVFISTAVMILAIAGYYYVMTKGQSKKSTNVGTEEVTKIGTADLDKALETNQQGLSNATAVIQTTRGKMKMKFFTKDAPKTVRRIAQLMKKGFYNGLTFHRVVPGFVIQGGDPTGTGMGGSGQRLAAEFNSRKHLIGTVAMARAADPDSADSQFYICLGAQPQLDGQYTVIGQLIDGQEVANQIQVGDRMSTITIELK